MIFVVIKLDNAYKLEFISKEDKVKVFTIDLDRGILPYLEINENDTGIGGIGGNHFRLKSSPGTSLVIRDDAIIEKRIDDIKRRIVERVSVDGRSMMASLNTGMAILVPEGSIPTTVKEDGFIVEVAVPCRLKGYVKEVNPLKLGDFHGIVLGRETKTTAQIGRWVIYTGGDAPFHIITEDGSVRCFAFREELLEEIPI